MKHGRLLIFIVFILSGCHVHDSLDLCKPCVCIPDEYSLVDEKGVSFGEWWKEFNSEELNETVEIVLQNNLDLQQSWWRVVQACYQAKIVEGRQWPAIDNIFSGSRRKVPPSSFSGLPSVPGFTVTPAPPFSIHLLSTSLSYEVDLWKKLDSRRLAANLQWDATQEELEATALTLTGTVVDLWFTIQEQKTLLKVINEQIDASRTQLELIELRFVVGQSSALDVYQQRLQLAQTVSELPAVKANLQTSINQMHVLMGFPPEQGCFSTEGSLVDLPPFPELQCPEVLLCSRPDLRAQQRLLQAADYEVAAAIADRFPQLDIRLTYDLQTNMIKRLFKGEAWELFGSILTPIFDADRRKNEVERRKAIVCELLTGYGNAFLNAMLEVEDSVIDEKYQLELIGELENQISLGESNLQEAQFHYIYGLNDYLTVIAALQNLQNTQRKLVSEKKRLLSFRSRLYRSLGGPSLNHYLFTN